MQLRSVTKSIKLPFLPKDTITQVIPGTNLSLESLFDESNNFTFNRSNGRTVTTLTVDTSKGSWIITRKQTILPQVSPQQPPVVSWKVENIRSAWVENLGFFMQFKWVQKIIDKLFPKIASDLKIPNINRAFQSIFAENREHLL